MRAPAGCESRRHEYFYSRETGRAEPDRAYFSFIHGAALR